MEHLEISLSRGVFKRQPFEGISSRDDLILLLGA